MKKIFVLLVAVFALGIAANAQDALGLRQFVRDQFREPDPEEIKLQQDRSSSQDLHVDIREGAEDPGFSHAHQCDQHPQKGPHQDRQRGDPQRTTEAFPKRHVIHVPESYDFRPDIFSL